MVAINDELGEKNRGEHWSPLIELSCMQIRDGDLRIAELRCLRRGKTYRAPEGTRQAAFTPFLFTCGTKWSATEFRKAGIPIGQARHWKPLKRGGCIQRRFGNNSIPAILKLLVSSVPTARDSYTGG